MSTSSFFFYQFTAKLRKPWTPELFMECYRVTKKKPIRCEKSKPKTAMVISLWFWGLFAKPGLCCDWSLHNQHSWNISGVHGFLSKAVIPKETWNETGGAFLLFGKTGCSGDKSNGTYFSTGNFSKKKEYLLRYNSFLVFTGMIEKSCSICGVSIVSSSLVN